VIQKQEKVLPCTSTAGYYNEEMLSVLAIFQVELGLWFDQ
jgi:hypothetical protein